MAAALVAAGASAQTVQESKTFDNFYVGINGGVATKTTGHAWLKGLDPNFGVRVGRWFTPVFGLAAESNAYFSNKPANSFGTAVRSMNTSLLATVNLSNWFGGYKGEPRCFEVIPVYGSSTSPSTWVRLRHGRYMLSLLSHGLSMASTVSRRLLTTSTIALFSSMPVSSTSSIPATAHTTSRS